MLVRRAVALCILGAGVADGPTCQTGCAGSVFYNTGNPVVYDGSCDPNSTQDFGVSVTLSNGSTTGCHYYGACVGECTWTATMYAFVTQPCDQDATSNFWLYVGQCGTQVFAHNWANPCSTYCQVWQNTITRDCGSAQCLMAFVLQDIGWGEMCAVSAYLRCAACP